MHHYFNKLYFSNVHDKALKINQKITGLWFNVTVLRWSRWTWEQEAIVSEEPATITMTTTSTSATVTAVSATGRWNLKRRTGWACERSPDSLTKTTESFLNRCFLTLTCRLHSGHTQVSLRNTQSFHRRSILLQPQTKTGLFMS